MESDNNNMRPPPSPGSTDTEEYEGWTVMGKGRKLKQNLTGEDSPKITISKETDSEEDGDHENKDDETCQECIKNEKLLQTPQRKRQSSETRVEDIEGGHEADGEISDGISVISESDLDHHDVVDLHEEPPHFNLHEKLAESLKQRKFDSDYEVRAPPPPKKPTFVVRAGPTELATLPTENSLIEKFKTTISNNKTTISVVVFAIIIAGAAGIFSHIGVMVRDYQTHSDDVAKFLIYQKKIDDLQMENIELKDRLINFESRLNTLDDRHQDRNTQKFGKNTNNNEGRKYEAKQPPYPPSGSGRGKKVKTRFDQFKRPPVAAGGDEDPVVTIHVSSMDEYETWNDNLNNNIKEAENKNLNIELDIEAIDPTNFEPISTMDVVENKTFSVPSPPDTEPSPPNAELNAELEPVFVDPTADAVEEEFQLRFGLNQSNQNNEEEKTHDEFKKEKSVLTQKDKQQNYRESKRVQKKWKQENKRFEGSGSGMYEKEKREKSVERGSGEKKERRGRAGSEERHNKKSEKQRKGQFEERNGDQKERRREESNERAYKKHDSHDRERSQNRSENQKHLPDRERSQDRERSHERKHSHGRERPNKREHSQDRDRSQEREHSQDRERSVGRERSPDRDHKDHSPDREFKNHNKNKYKRGEDSDDSRENDSHEKRYNKHEKRDNYERKRSPNHHHNDHDRRSKERKHSENKHHKDEWKKREKSSDGSGSRSDSRSGSKAKYPNEDKNWLDERKENRENNRKNMDDDWFSERSLERELLRARAEGSAERSH